VAKKKNVYGIDAWWRVRVVKLMAKRWERYIANHGTLSKGATTISIITLDLTTLYVIVLNATFSIIIFGVQSQYAYHGYVETSYAECHYAECRSVECRGAPKTAAFGSIAEIFLEKTTTNHKEIFIRELGCKEREREQREKSVSE
jgi:hypothetical protein